jgi:hypothetical protein
VSKALMMRAAPFPEQRNHESQQGHLYTSSATIVTATLTATTAAANALRPPSTSSYSRTSYLSWASVTPEKRKVNGVPALY